MAANEYYNDSRHYNTYEPSVASTNPPSYTTQPRQQDRPSANTVSPFESVFDDHVYPTGPQPTHQTPDSSLNNLGSSQQAFAYDTRYHGAAPGDVSPVGTDEIPLRNQAKSPAGYAVDSNDHVYDTADQEVGHRGVPKRGLLRFGELGMLGSEKRRIPVMVYLFSLIQIAVFIAELVKAAQLTGSPIQTKPSFNPMIGPSQQVLINMGSRFVPCMKNVDGVQNYPAPGYGWPCPNTTTSDVNDGSNQCSLSELCGFAGVPNPEWDSVNGLNQSPEPNQWFRFITPIFMHAGIIHIGFNLLLQLTMGKEIERAIGSIRFFLVYMSAGIFGFVMGGNYAASGISSTGASGSLFGIIALTLLDLLYSWGERRNPGRELVFILVEIIVSFALGLLPGLDNFSHIGGFIVGICLGVSVLHSPNALRRKIGEDHFGGPSYSSVGGGGITSVAFPAFYRNPVGFFKGRKPLWWAWWLVRAAFLILIIVVFIVLLKNFYSNQNNCSWCKYLSCLPVNNWCDIGNLTISTSSSSSTTQRRGVDVFALEQIANLYS